MSEQTLSTDKQFISLLTPWLPKDLIRYAVWAVSRIPEHGLTTLYHQCQLLHELIQHYQPAYHFTHTDKQIMFAGCLLADTGKYFSETHYARIGYGLAYEYIHRAVPGEFADQTLDQIAQCVYDTRPRRRRPPASIYSQFVYLANQGVPCAERLATDLIALFMRSGISDDDVILDHASNALTDLYGEYGTYWHAYPDMGKTYFHDEWQEVLHRFSDPDFLPVLLERIKRKQHDPRHASGCEEHV